MPNQLLLLKFFPKASTLNSLTIYLTKLCILQIYFIRLSESGLSMTDWSILKGIKPPITDSDWQNEFDRYKNFPEYEL